MLLWWTYCGDKEVVCYDPDYGPYPRGHRPRQWARLVCRPCGRRLHRAAALFPSSRWHRHLMEGHPPLALLFLAMAAITIIIAIEVNVRWRRHD